MQEFFQSIGLDGKLLLSQAVNFLLLLIILRVFAYKPILKIIKERRERIEEGLTKAEEADRRLSEITTLKKEKLQEAEQEGMALLRETEEKAKDLEAELLERAHKKESEILKKADHLAGVREQEASKKVQDEAGALVKEAIIKTVELDPEQVDEKLITKALSKVR